MPTSGLKFTKFADAARDLLSSPLTVTVLAIVLEAYGLRAQILPNKLLTQIPAVPYFEVNTNANQRSGLVSVARLEVLGAVLPVVTDVVDHPGFHLLLHQSAAQSPPEPQLLDTSSYHSSERADAV